MSYIDALSLGSDRGALAKGTSAFPVLSQAASLDCRVKLPLSSRTSPPENSSYHEPLMQAPVLQVCVL